MKIFRPTLLLDKEKCLNNIQEMVHKARKNEVIFRPHFKTHQSHEIGQWFKNEGVTCCTVSTLDMAIYFAQDGWEDITVAFPINRLEIDKINHLAERIVLNVLVEDPETLMRLDADLDHELNAYIKIDIGYGRTGIPIDENDRIEEMLSSFNSVDLISFKGFLAHAGHSYKCRSVTEIMAVHENSQEKCAKLRNYRDRFPKLIISVGDTPTCSVADDFSWCDEIRPGNFVFYDLAQWQIGSNQLEDIAVAMACPVVAKHPNRNQVIIYGGGAHFAKDRLILDEGKTIWGLLVNYREGDIQWSIPANRNWVISLSQEHGVIEADSELMESVQIGDILTILPVHSCMAALAMGEYLTTENEFIGRL